MSGIIAILFIIISGISFILGITRFAKRLLLFGVILIFAVPLLFAALAQLTDGGLGSFVLLIIIGFFFFAYMKFKHRQHQIRQMRQYLDNPLSLKRRIDRDQF